LLAGHWECRDTFERWPDEAERGNDALVATFARHDSIKFNANNSNCCYSRSIDESVYEKAIRRKTRARRGAKDVMWVHIWVKDVEDGGGTMAHGHMNGRGKLA
jgi:hypothetical protein